MPYASLKQARKFHAMEARGEMPASTVKEFDKSTNFKGLPMRAKKKRPRLSEYVK